MIRLIFTFILVTFSLAIHAQEFLWTRALNSPGADIYGTVSNTPDGGFVHVHAFSGGINIGDSSYSSSNINVLDFLLFKTNLTGDILWSKHFSGNSFKNAHDVTVDQNSGDIYIQVNGGGTMNFGSITVPGSLGSRTTLVALDSNGTTKWVRNMVGQSLGDHIEVDPSGDVYCSGQFFSTLIVESDTLSKYPGFPHYTPFLVKYDSAGNYLWSKVFQLTQFSNHLFSDASGQLLPFKINQTGDLFIGLNFKDSVVVDSDTLTSPFPFTQDFAFLKMSASGTLDTFTINTGSSFETCTDIHIDHNDRVFYTGRVSPNSAIGNDTAANLTTSSIYVAEYDVTGSLIYTFSGLSRGHYINGDTNGNLYLTGGFNNTISLAGETLTAASGQSRSFITKYDVNSQSWEWVLSSTLPASTSSTHFFSDIAVVSEDNILVTGRFDAGLQLGNDVFNAAGDHDALLTRISKCDQLDAPLTSSVASGCSSTSAVLSTTLSNDYSYTWYANGAEILNLDTNVFTAITSGNYFVVVDSFGCKDSSQVFNFVSGSSNLNVSLSAFSSICENASPMALSGGSPAGGVYSGSGISGSTFDPSITGVGTVPITYTYTDSTSGCADSATQNIQVVAAPFIFMNTLDTNCTNGSLINLNVGLPPGGTYSGTGVSGNTFDPSQGSAGTNTIFYTRTSGGCSSTDSVNIELVQPPAVTFTLDASMCNNASPVFLSATPSGGTFSGTGVSGNFLIPQILDPGPQTVSYSLTSNGCTSISSATTQIDSVPQATLSALPSLCLQDASISLGSFAAPSGGVFSGLGVSGTSFDPALAGAGNHPIQYVTSNSCGNDTATQNIQVNAQPSLSFPSLGSACIDQNPVSLTGATPLGGTYSGTGVSGASFDPSLAGAGSFNVQYQYTDANGCSDSLLSSIVVHDLPAVSLDTLGGICDNRSAFNLTLGSPVGGIYSGTGVAAGQFDPSLVSVGNYNILYQFTDANGCTNSDSITAEVRATFADTLFHVACDSFTSPFGNTYYASGIYVDSLLSLGNCDSIIVRDVTINLSTIDTHQVVVCDSFISVTGNVYAASGVYFDTLSTTAGCDSILRTELTVNPQTAGAISVASCDQYTSPAGMVYTLSGIYIDSLTNSNGCDSILTINLTINNSVFDTLTTAVCDDFTTPGGQFLTSTGVYADSFLTSTGCDSILVVDLTVFQSSRDTNLSVTCESYTSAGGVAYTASGTYTENYFKVNGCDSTVVEEVTILSASSSTINPVVCDQYISPSGKLFTASGSYSDTLTNSVSCDSIISINLQINQSYLDTLIVTACDSFLSPISNQWIMATGIYTDSFTSVTGCDSIWMTFIDVNTTTTILSPVTACDSFIFTGLGTFFSSQIVYDTVPGINGCDFITGFDITIINSVAQTISITACDTFISPAGMTYTSSGVYTEGFTAANGCDSTVAYDVLINNSASTSISVIACDSFISPLGDHYVASGIYTAMTTTVEGCDSTVTYDVTINPSLLTQVKDTACGQYQTPLGQLITVSGVYYDSTLTTSGCDSIIAYDITIGALILNEEDIISCGPYESSWGEVFSANGTYVDSSTTVLGCDSVSVLNLVISEVEVGVTQTANGLLADADSTINSFQWLICGDAFIPYIGYNDATFIPTISSSYAVEVENQDGCVDTSECIYFTRVGVLETKGPVMNVFPNPTRGALNIEFDQTVRNGIIQVRNSIGQVVLDQVIENQRQVQLSLNQAAGVYLVRVSTELGSKDLKVIVQ